MDFGILTQLDPVTVLLALAVALVAGVVKGAIGFAMPLILVSGISSLTDPKLAIAAMLLPTVLSNVFQTFRKGIAPAIAAAREYWRYLLVVCIFIAISAQLVPLVSTRIFYFLLGVPVVALSVLQLAGVQMQVAPEYRRRAEWGLGVISGVLGGFAGTWGPTTVLYLMAINTPKAKQMVVQGVVYGLGSITLITAHVQSGIFNRDTAPLSAALLPMAMLGLWIGFRIQDRLDQALFRKVTLVVLILAGVNLLRKGLAG
ncbi:sulfite exporter TauE/SafE family protein [Cognatishimia sp. SS12]|uniref:sulfite exporter TauE/SafE family protein n=1 Tax=Cognatishimia sp. SS12 TaxID=2979465 RepID=UPI00232B410F|nr:sulfite exporter TauE/SafE family protein [Cognatishimia sp. SS12]MDC0739272.1 sulfite exporter TauE/SafE family protein [Cognatishimia sp. SS12]